MRFYVSLRLAIPISDAVVDEVFVGAKTFVVLMREYPGRVAINMLPPAVGFTFVNAVYDVF